jgi:hypothetical protein
VSWGFQVISVDTLYRRMLHATYRYAIPRLKGPLTGIYRFGGLAGV